MESDDSQEEALEPIVARLRQGRLGDAAAAFAQRLGLAVEGSGDAGLRDNPDAAGMPELLAALLVPQPIATGWWAEVASSFLAIGAPVTARACAARARRLIDEGAPVSWSDLRRLALLDGQAVLEHRRIELADKPAAAVMPGESADDKQARLGLIIGAGSAVEVDQQIEEARRARDVRGLALCMRGAPSGGRIDAWIDTWFQAGESRIAFESFLAAIQGERLMGWLPRFQGALALAGMALNRLGDPITAYACFQLLAWCEPGGAPAEGDRNRQSDTPAQVAHHYVRDLQWAAGQLDAPYDGFRLSEAGSRIGAWLAENHMAGRMRSHLAQGSGLAALFPPEALARQQRAVGRAMGWFLPEGRLPARPAADEARRPPLPPPPPATLPLTAAPASLQADGARPAGLPATAADASPLPATTDTAAIGEAGAAAAPRHVLDMRWSPRQATRHVSAPRPLAEHDGSSDLALRLRLGYAITPGGPRPALAQVAPGASLLLAMDAIDHQLPLSLARQARVAGRLVVWLRRASGGAESPPLPSWLRLALRSTPDDDNAGWLHDIAASPPVRATVANLLAALPPPSRDLAALPCMDDLLSRCAVQGSDSALFSSDPTDIAGLAMQVVSDVADFPFGQPASLRRAAHLVGQVKRAAEALRRSVSQGWTLPERAEGAPPPRPEGLFVDIPDGEPTQAALTALLILGSFARWASPSEWMVHSQAATALNLDDFDIVVRPRPDAAGADADATRQAVARAASPPSEEDDDDEPDDSSWLRSGLLRAGQPARLCVLLTGDWGGEALPLVEWFKPGGLLQRHELIASLSTDRAEALRRDLLSHCRSLVIGDLPASSRELLAIATGIDASGWQEALPALAANERVAFLLAQQRVAGERLVVWPA